VSGVKFLFCTPVGRSVLRDNAVILGASFLIPYLGIAVILEENPWPIVWPSVAFACGAIHGAWKMTSYIASLLSPEEVAEVTRRGEM
jgi:hypothetical protein